jgi:enoyl-CoA hydratase
MIEREIRDELTVLRLDHGRAHALDLELVEALGRAFAAEEENAPRAVVLTGAGKAFSAGVDLVRFLEEDAGYAARFLAALDALLERMLRFPRPTVAAVNGHAIAGGCILACACDLRVAARGGARLGVPELRVGLPFPPLALEIVREALAPPAFRRVVLLGGYHGVEEALDLGLVDELAEPDTLLERALALAGELGSIPPASYAEHQRQAWAPVFARAARHDRAAIDAVWCAEPARAAVRAYVERTLRK